MSRNIALQHIFNMSIIENDVEAIDNVHVEVIETE